MDIGFMTDKGKLRQNNEDSFSVNRNAGLFIVADGVGGQNAGEIASSLAVREIGDYVVLNLDRKRTGGKYIFGCLNEGIHQANDKILEKSNEDEAFSKMATTAVVMLIKDETAYISNIGDSRAYLIREGNIIRLTEDHTMANQLLLDGVITREEMKELAQNALPLNMFSTITRALGDIRGVEADNFFVDIEDNDIFLMCTDGLYGEVSDENLLKIISDGGSAQKACKTLVQEANKHGGKDNITAILIKIGVKDHE